MPCTQGDVHDTWLMLMKRLLTEPQSACNLVMMPAAPWSSKVIPWVGVKWALKRDKQINRQAHRPECPQ